MGRTALVALLVLLAFGSLSTANAHYKDAKLDVYKVRWPTPDLPHRFAKSGICP